jgi:hypothetical protein
MQSKDEVGLTSRIGSWPAHGWLELGQVVSFWILNWSLAGLRTHWGFFPLAVLAYCLVSQQV